jgi:hypothetical protein
VNRGSWAREVVHLITLKQDRLRNIVPDELKLLVVEHVLDVALCPSEQVVDCYHLVSLMQQNITQVRPDKTRSSSYYYSRHTCSFRN